MPLVTTTDNNQAANCPAQGKSSSCGNNGSIALLALMILLGIGASLALYGQISFGSYATSRGFHEADRSTSGLASKARDKGENVLYGLYFDNGADTIYYTSRR